MFVRCSNVGDTLNVYITYNIYVCVYDCAKVHHRGICIAILGIGKAKEVAPESSILGSITPLPPLPLHEIRLL